jgi:hypothetical protein
VDYLCYFVDKKHHLFLEYLSHVCEVPDIAEPKHTKHPLTSDEWIDSRASLHVFSDDVGTSLSET